MTLTAVSFVKGLWVGCFPISTLQGSPDRAQLTIVYLLHPPVLRCLAYRFHRGDFRRRRLGDGCPLRGGLYQGYPQQNYRCRRDDSPTERFAQDYPSEEHCDHRVDVGIG